LAAPSANDDDPAGQRAVVAETLAYAEVDEQLVKGHFVFPEDMVDPLPAIVLIHEWWGLNDEMRGLADRFAAAGYIVLAVDLYGGKTSVSPVEARELMLQVIEKPDFAEQNIRQACNWVLTTTGASDVAVVGYGFGGSWSLRAAAALPKDVEAIVMYYGQVLQNEASLAAIETPILGFFAGDDGTVPVETVTAFRNSMEDLGKTVRVEVYPGAKNGFASPGSRNFDARLAGTTWDTMLAFLREHLQANSDRN
jgi:carboxymethylenebutenolidase